MGNIVVMDDRLANKIAAGEVVERPASVVKELVENAIDAEADKIEVHIEEGGLSLIRIVDNGHGMDREDCLLALERHATSKIKNDRDLFRIKTLGFRGEALPSIAAVSRLQLRSKTRISPSATSVTVEGGKRLGDEPVALSGGTEIIIRDLFFNTPARLKYMKTIPTEVGHVSDLLNRLALSHPSISFLFTHNGRTLLRTAGDGSLLHVIAAIYGTETAKMMIPIAGESIDATIKGYVSRPEVTRANRSYISTIVNGRYVKNYSLANAVLNGYHTLLPINRLPVAVLLMEMDPLLVDVNVHPSKLQIRYSKETELHDLIRDTIKSALHGQRLIPEPAAARNEPARIRYSQPELDLSRKLPDEKDSSTRQLIQQGKPDKEEVKRFNEWLKEDIQPFAKNEENPIVKNVDQASDVLPEVSKAQQGIPLLQPLAQLHGTYILSQGGDGLYIIDQHAAQERIFYEHFRKKIEEEIPESQELLVPISLDVTTGEAEMIKQHLAFFEGVGVTVEPFGAHSFLIRSHPRWLPIGEEEAILREMIQMILEQKQRIDIVELRDKSAMSMACKAAIKANRHLTMLEMEALLDKLRESSNPFTCPHGRPIVVHFSTYEIEKMFKRVM